MDRYTKVLENIYDPGRLNTAWQQVKSNAGAAGIDGMSAKDFAQREDELLKLIHEKLKAGIYRFKPARRVLIPKGGGKMRALGIPVIMDRIVSQSVNVVFHSGNLRADFYGIEFWISKREKPTSSNKTCTEDSSGRARVVCCDRSEKFL